MQWSQILAQNRVFCLPHLQSTPLLGRFSSEFNIAMPLVWKKLEWLGYQTVKKIVRYAYSFWQNVRTWQTNRHTDRQTANHHVVSVCLCSIVRQKWLKEQTDILPPTSWLWPVTRRQWTREDSEPWKYGRRRLRPANNRQHWYTGTLALSFTLHHVRIWTLEHWLYPLLSTTSSYKHWNTGFILYSPPHQHTKRTHHL